MLTLTIASLSGGQGKSTTAYFLGRLLAERGYRTLLVDADPQHNLTLYMGLEVGETDPTLLEVLRWRDIPGMTIAGGIYPLEHPNLFLIPADYALHKAEESLQSSGSAATVLRRCLQEIADQFEICLIDSPPSRRQIAYTSIGAANMLLIPAEANTKGLEAINSTLALIREMGENIGLEVPILGLLPFRNKIHGLRQVTECQNAIALMETLGYPMFTSIVDSAQHARAMNNGKTLAEQGYAALQHPFEEIIEKLEETKCLKPMAQCSA